MPRPLDEQALRRADFRGGVPVKLWDGQEWTLPRPVLAGFYPRRKPDGSVGMTTGLDFGPDYDTMVDAYIDADGAERVERLMALGVHLLLMNYDVPDADLPTLLYRTLQSDPRDDENEAMWGAISDVALGNAPKLIPAGSG